MSARARVDDALFGPETGARLLVAHTGLAVLIGLRIALGPFRPLAGTPRPLFDPVPFLGWLHAVPSTRVIVGVQVVGVLAALTAAVRRHPRLGFVLAWTCYLVLAGLRGSRGKVLHNDLLLLWVAVPFLLAPLDVRWEDRRPRRDHGWPIRSGMAIAAVIYALAGFHKLMTSGPSWALGDNIRYVLLWGGPATRGLVPLSHWVSDHWWAYKGTGVLMLLVELTFPVAVLWRRARPVYVVAAVALHVATFLFLGLDYWAWAGTVLLVFVDWPALSTRLTRMPTAPSWSPKRSVRGSR